MKKLLFMQENEFSGTTSMYPSTMQPLCTQVNKLATSNFQICFPAPYLSPHAKYSHMPKMPPGRTSPGLPYPLSNHKLEIEQGRYKMELKMKYISY